MQHKLYGICGGIGCGKDEVTRILIELGEERGVVYENRKYAFELKRLLAFILDVDVEMFEDRHFKDTPIPDMEITQIHYKSIRERHDIIVVNTFSSVFEPDAITAYLKPGYEYLGLETIEVTPRWLMQNVGTKCFRDIISKDFWVWKTFKDYTQDSNWILSDVRYPKNEGRVITNNRGLLIGVNRRFDLRYPQYGYLMDKEKPYSIPIELKDVNRDLFLSLTSDSELSSHEMSWCDVVIDNDGTLEELKEKVKNILC